MNNPVALLDNPSELNTPRPLQWLARSKVMAVVWTAMRVWLGVMWIQAGASKLWGAENSACRAQQLHHVEVGHQRVRQLHQRPGQQRFPGHQISDHTATGLVGPPGS
jgi:hypothetical protein